MAETTPYRSDSEVALLKKIVLLSGCPGVDCCGPQTFQNLLYLWARCAPCQTPYRGDSEQVLLFKIAACLAEGGVGGVAPRRDDSEIVLLKKIVQLSGCPGVDCCGPQTSQNLLYLLARCMHDGLADADGDGIFEGSGEGLPPPPGACPGVVGLGTAEDFAVLGASTVTNTGLTVLNGDLGLSPGSSVTGFPPGVVNGTQHIANAIAAQAQLDLTTAYLDAEGRPGGIPVAGDIGGQTLGAGVYKSTSSLEISSGNLTLDGGGDPCAVFLFQIASTLLFTTGRQVLLTNGASAKNVFWQVGSSGTFQVTSGLKGTVMALASITAQTGAIVEGRLLARNAAVTLDTNTITLPA